MHDKNILFKNYWLIYAVFIFAPHFIWYTVPMSQLVPLNLFYVVSLLLVLVLIICTNSFSRNINDRVTYCDVITLYLLLQLAHEIYRVLKVE